MALVWFFFLAFFSSACYPQVPSIEATKLAQDPTWLRLLKADKTGRNQSAIHSAEFFLGDGEFNATTELQLLLQALDSTEAVDDNHPLCRFPARSNWLALKLDRLDLADFANCHRLNEWARTDQLESITLIMISGYFGSPASTFGHSLLRLDNGGNAQSSLLDLGINFGAQIPPDEPTLIYILRGLFGGYQAGFSDRTFFEHDQTYSRIEFRDRWEYRLNLTTQQKTLLAYHLWELAGKKFTYYFLRENCSYRLAELLELIFDAPILDGVTTWYAPVSLFHDLRELQNGDNVFDAVRYVPSTEQVLRYSLAGLSETERQTVLRLVAPTVPTSDVALGKQPGRMQRMQSAALDLNTNQLANETNQHPTHRERQRQQLAMRLQLPPAAIDRRNPPTRVPPSSLAPPSSIDAAITQFADDRLATRLGISAFRYEPTGNNALDGAALVVADLQLGLTEEDGVYVAESTIVRARKFNTP